MAKKSPFLFPEEKQDEGMVLLALSALMLHGRLCANVTGPSQEQLADSAVDQATKLIASVKKKLG